MLFRSAPVGRLLGVAAGAIALFAAGALLGGPLGLMPGATPAPSPRVASPAALAGSLADLLGLAGQVTVALTDAAGEAAGAVILVPADGRVAIVTRALGPSPAGWSLVFERDGARTTVGPIETGTDAGANADTDAGADAGAGWWAGTLPEGIAPEIGRAHV